MSRPIAPTPALIFFSVLYRKTMVDAREMSYLAQEFAPSLVISPAIFMPIVP